jgi:protein gp37
MSGKTSIEWTEQTWNPVAGCSLVSPGCTNCYAMVQAARLLDRPGSHYEGTTKRVNGKPVWTGKIGIAPDSVLHAPLRRKKPTMYFVNSMADLFHEAVPDAVIDRVFAVMALSPRHIFQVLTKRAKRMREYFSNPDLRSKRIAQAFLDLMIARMVINHITDDNYPLKDGQPDDEPRLATLPLPNVWLGVSAEDQVRADERIPDLLATSAAVRFVSAEPLLSALDFTSLSPNGIQRIDALRGRSTTPDYGGWPRLDWIIVGGESGDRARPMHPDWARSIRDQCQAAGVAVFVKQLSSGGPKAIKDMALFPEDLRVREMPNAR